MNAMKRDLTILTVGDTADRVSFLKFNLERDFITRRGCSFATVRYEQVLNGKLPLIETGSVVVVLFFPFVFWNRHVEYRGYPGLYGNAVFGRKLFRFMAGVDTILRRALRGKKIVFINEPRVSGMYRDKLAVMRKLSRAGIPQPRYYTGMQARRIEKQISDGRSFFLKPRCGSLGKGITYLSQSVRQTNFLIRDGRLTNRWRDHGWRFSDIAGRRDILKQALNKGMLVEDAVEPLVLDGTIIDFRVYTFRGKAVCVYPRRSSPHAVITNLSQGGAADLSLLRALPARVIRRAKRMAEAASKALKGDLLGIDIMPGADPARLYVLDVNFFPGFPKRENFNLARHIIADMLQSDSSGRLFHRRK
jgi:hypothetical protein